MKTFLLIAIAFSFAVQAQAEEKTKVNDFNAIIAENISSQKELHKSLRHNLNDTQLALEKEAIKQTEPHYIVDNAESMNIPASDKNFLRFKKELKYNRPSQTAANKRLAVELDQAQ